MRIVITLALLFIAYWFILRPVLRRRAELVDFYAAADTFEVGFLTRLRLMFKGFKTIVWARFLMIAGMAVPLLDWIGMFDITGLLPPVTIPVVRLVVQPYQYSMLLVSAIGWVTERLRKVSNTPAGEGEVVVVAAPPVVEATGSV